MTKDELKKRLIKIQATPEEKRVGHKEMSRRGINHIDPTDDLISNFDDFFGFEEELSEMESARLQVEKIEKRKILEAKFVINNSVNTEPSIDEASVNTDNNDDDESYFLWDIDDENESGNDESFLTFEEEDDSDDNEEFINDILVEPETIIEIVTEEPNDLGFKYCTYIKDDNERCKRQAPKKSDYCSAHRKLIAKDG